MPDLNQVKSLLKKAKILDDKELLDIANAMLDDIMLETSTEVKEEAPAPVKKKRGRPRKKAATKQVATKKSIVDQFTTEAKESKSKYQPVFGNKNSWVDDGSDDETYKLEDKAQTPKVKPSPRTRGRAQKVQVVCGADNKGKQRDDEGCGKTVEVNPKFARDYFICEECINKKVKGR